LYNFNSNNAEIVIRSNSLTEGLFGQIFNWCLEILPYLEKENILPYWEVISHNYGGPPNFNIFPDVLQLNYTPKLGNSNPLVLNFEKIKFEVGHPNYSFLDDFVLAKNLFDKYFKIPDDVLNVVDNYLKIESGNKILGLHYRGTDKNTDKTQTNSVTPELFLKVANDFINEKKDIDFVYIASDEQGFIEMAIEALTIPVLQYNQERKEKNIYWTLRGKRSTVPFRGHNPNDNILTGKNALVDSLILSKCNYLIKCQSALSAWAKVWNPKLEAYRIAANKNDWFPDAYIPIYTSKDRHLQRQINVLLKGDISFQIKSVLKPVRHYLNEKKSDR